MSMDGSYDSDILTLRRMSGLDSVDIYQDLYRNKLGNVEIPLYSDMTAAQLKIRLPISVGVAKQIVDNSADSLFGAGKLLGIQMLDQGGRPDERIQMFWDLFWKKNRFRFDLIRDAVTMLVEGGLFYVLEYLPGRYPCCPFRVKRLTYADLWDIEVDDELTDNATRYVFQWEEVDRSEDQDKYQWHRLEIDATSMARYREYGSRPSSDANGDRVKMALTEYVEHGFGVVPVVHIRHNAPAGAVLGISLIEPLRPMLDPINQMASDAYWQCYNDQAILKAVNITPSSDDESPEDDAAVRLGGDQIHHITQTEQLKQDIERMTPVGIPDSFFRTLAVLIENVYKAANEVHLDPSKWTTTNISGVALQILYTPVTKKTHRNRLVWEESFEALANLLCVVADSRSVGPDASGKLVLGGAGLTEGLSGVNVQWGEILSQDEEQQQRIVLGDLEANVIDLATARRQRGYDEESVAGGDRTE